MKSETASLPVRAAGDVADVAVTEMVNKCLIDLDGSIRSVICVRWSCDARTKRSWMYFTTSPSDRSISRYGQLIGRVDDCFLFDWIADDRCALLLISMINLVGVDDWQK